MAVITSTSNHVYISHEKFINELYSDIQHDDRKKSFTYNKFMFKIIKPFKTQRNEVFNLSDETKIIKTKFDIFKNETKFCCLSAKTIDNTEARKNSSIFLTETSLNLGVGFKGGNNSSETIIVHLQNDKYIIPKNCSFYCYDITDIEKHLNSNTFDFILLDPPWWNKSIRKKRKWNAKEGYDMIYNEYVANIPISKILNNSGLIAVWCTNAPSHIKAIHEDIFPKWGVKYVSQWFWLKVTQNGEVICPFTKPQGKQPYERIIFGMKDSLEKIPEDGKLIVSVPSAIHSHKPPLCEIMQPYLCESARCLELFARYLLPGWTSYGNEVLKLQQLSLFEEKES